MEKIGQRTKCTEARGLYRHTQEANERVDSDAVGDEAGKASAAESVLSAFQYRWSQIFLPRCGKKLPKPTS